jgi:hypothetical protein
VLTPSHSTGYGLTCDICTKTIRQGGKFADSVGIIRGLHGVKVISSGCRTSRSRLTRVTVPSPLLLRSADLDFFPRTTISRCGPGTSLALSFLVSAAVLWFFVSSISGAPSGGMKVCSFSALLCLFLFGSTIEPSLDRGRCLRREVRTGTGGAAPFWEGENIVNRVVSREKELS